MRTVDTGEMERDYDGLMRAVARGERLTVVEPESGCAVVLMPQRDYDAMVSACRDHCAR